MNPSTAFATAFADELVRCGLREVVLAPGSRSAPLALAFHALAQGPAGQGLRLHVRIDERSAAYLALGLAKASRRPAAVLCTSGTAAASFHPAVIEADESGVPLLVLTADRPPELRGTGANQAVDQIRLYGVAVRWFCEVGVAEVATGQVAYWRSLACRAWADAAGLAGGLAGPVHLNLPLRDPLVPGAPGGKEWPEPLDGRPEGAPWTAFPGEAPGAPSPSGALELPWTERGVVVCGDGDYDAGPLLRLARQAGWPVLAEPSSGARRGPNALRCYQYLLASEDFTAEHAPALIVSAGRPGLSRPQLAFLRGTGARRHVVIAQGPGRWADPARSATDVVPAVRLAAPAGNGPAHPERSAWLASWQRADATAGRAVDEILDGLDEPSEPRLARDLAAALPDGALLWAASSLPVRDLDQQMAPRAGLRVLASRGASGIDGLVSAAMGAALAHQAGRGGQAVALLGDLAVLHDSPGLVLGPDEPRPDLCLVVVNNDGGGIFSTLEQAAFESSFERLFGTPHGATFEAYARAAGMPYVRLDSPEGLAAVLRPAAVPATGRSTQPRGAGPRVIEVRTSRAGQTALRGKVLAAALGALAS